MKKTAAFIGLWLILIIPGWTASVYIKLAAGFSYAEMTAINRNLQDWLAYYVRDAEVHKNYELLSGSVPVFRTLFNFDGEIVWSLTNRLSLSVGTGFIFGEVPQNKTETVIVRPAGTFTYVNPVQISAIPLTLDASYSLPLLKRLQVYIRAGGGMVWTKYVDRTGLLILGNKNYFYQTYNYATSGNPLFQGGFGLQFDVETGIRFYIEAIYRAARISGLKGENKDGQQGLLYSYGEYSSDLDIWTSRFGVFSEPPSGGIYREVKEADFKLEGMSVRLGMMFRF